MTRRRPGGGRHTEAGTVTVLIIGFAAICLLLIAVAVDASAAFLRRQQLAGLADGAALAAVDAGADGTGVYTEGLGGEAVAVDPALAHAAAADYLTRSGARARFPSLSLSVRVDGAQVVVRLSADLDLPLQVPGSPAHPQVAATGSASVLVQ